MEQPPSLNKIAFLTSWDPQDKAAWSGMVHASRAALAERVEVVDVRIDTTAHSVVDRGLARGLGSVGSAYLPSHGAASALEWGRTTTRALQAVSVDAVVAVAVSSLTAFAHIQVPLISVSDSTFVLVSAMYPSYRALPSWAKTQAQWVERRAWRRSDSCVVSSHWALDSLVADYGIAASKCNVAPFGPGISPPSGLRSHEPGDPTRLLLVARDWQRKRGDRALAMLPFLERMGVKASLTVVGAPADAEKDIDGVTWLPPRSQAEMADLYATSDVVLDLAEANCASVTLVDAVSWGLPTVATGVGAAREIVLDGVTGFVVPNDERTPEAAAKAVAEIARGDGFHQMRAGNQSDLKGRFTWSAWAQEISDIAARLVSRPPASRRT